MSVVLKPSLFQTVVYLGNGNRPMPTANMYLCKQLNIFGHNPSKMIKNIVKKISARAENFKVQQ